MKLFITGGKARKSNNIARDWSSFRAGVAILYDTEKKKVELEFDYVTPLDSKPSEASSVLFKACSKVGEVVYICSKTEYIKYNFDKKCIEKTVSHPLMNDVHHVAAFEDRVYVVSTGLDSVLIFDRITDEYVGCEYLGGGSIEDKFDLACDYRKVESLKPHECHPNYVFSFNGDIYVTRFMQKDCINLVTRQTTPISDSFIHDGVDFDGSLYFTSVDGRFYRTILDGKVEEFDLRKGYESNDPLGWCRAILPVGDGRVLVGFSVLRNTKFKENIKWAYSKISSRSYTSMRTRLVLYDMKTSLVEDEIMLDELGMDAVFGVLSV